MMDIKSAEKSHQNVTFGDDSFEYFLDHLKDQSFTSSYHLCLFVGPTAKDKQKALQQIADKSDRTIREVDGNEIISKIESETYENWEHEFAHYSADDTILYIRNGGRFSGEYTGYTNSKVKYATPQERYFLNRMQEKGGLYIIDLMDTTDGDTTFHRAAQSIVRFPKPQSVFNKLMWRLKQISVHGHQIKTERPERYGNQAGNF